MWRINRASNPYVPIPEAMQMLVEASGPDGVDLAQLNTTALDEMARAEVMRIANPLTSPLTALGILSSSAEPELDGCVVHLNKLTSHYFTLSSAVCNLFSSVSYTHLTLPTMLWG